ncbi:MAG: serine/threonine-protein kinase [Deltaproteobacteria bacterium]|nr:serine/threonine-protein kinase [Deltaproteobacteria bacterium]
MTSTLRFGDYDVDMLLGPGSVTETYRASRNGGTSVALKLLRPDRGGSDPKVRDAFIAIAKRNKTLRLPGVAKVVDIHEGPDDVFIATELLDGVNLEGLFDSATASGSMDPQLVGQMGVQIARVLTRLHERREPIVHGGLCPANVIVTSGGRVTLVDPGISAALRSLTEYPVDRSWFTAPEVLLDKQAPSVASDIYGLGAVLFYLLTGEPPVMGETEEELQELFDEGPPTVPGLPDWLEDSLAVMLSRDPHDRPRSAAAAALSLNPFPEGATRLGAIVSGNTPGPISVGYPQTSEFDPMVGRGTMVLGDAVSPQSASSSSLSAVPSDGGLGLEADSPENPFDAQGSEAGVRPALESQVPPAPAAKAKAPPATPPKPAPGPMTLTPLRPVAVLDAAAQPALGLSNEPQWADSAPAPVALASEPRWADDGISIGLSNEPQWADKPASKGGPALPNEPQWVDAGASMVAAARMPMPGMDDYLDLPGAAPLGASSNGIGVAARVELPELDVDMASPTISPAVHEDDDRAPQGFVSFGNRTSESPVDVSALGAVGFSEEDEEAQAAGGGGVQGIVLPQVPRRAGSARKGAAAAKSSGSLAKVAIVLVVLAGGGALAMKMLSKPVTVLPGPEQLAKENPSEAAAEVKATAQKPPEDSQARGELTIITTPRGATIWVDGQEKGKTPLTVQTAPGAHRVVIVKPGFKMLREVTDTAEGLTIKRTLPPANINFGGNVMLKVECKTTGKYPVFIDGKDTGLLCPIEGVKVPDGNRLIGVYVIPDNKIWSFEREVNAGTKAHRVVFSY